MKKGFPDEIYSEHIMKIYNSQNCFGDLKNPTHTYSDLSSSCGDELSIQLIIKNRKISDIKFNGSGCIISIVSASLLSEKVKGMEINKINKIQKKEIIKNLKINLPKKREECAILCLKILKKALNLK